jgi:HEAT repeat protein
MEVIGAGSPESKRKARRSWAKWWREKNQDIDLSAATATRRPGLVLVCEEGQFPTSAEGRLWLCGCDGKPRWTLKGLRGPVQVELVEGDKVLIAEAHRLTERDLNGKVHRQKNFTVTGRRGHAFQRLANGRVLVDDGPQVWELGGKEMDPSNSPSVHETHAVGADRTGNANKPTAKSERVEVWWFDPGDAQKRRQVILQEHVSFSDAAGSTGPHASWLNSGRILLSVDSPPLVLEMNLAGRTMWRHKLIGMQSLNQVIPLRCGTFLSACRLLSWHRVIELDAGGSTLWEAFVDGDLCCIGHCLGLVRVGFARRLGVGYSLDSAAIRGADLKSKDVRRRRHAAFVLRECGAQGRGSIEPLIRALGDPDELVRSLACDSIVEMGPEAIPALTQATHHRSAVVRAEAIDALARLRPSSGSALARIIEALEDRDMQVCESALAAVRKFGPQAKAALPSLRRVLACGETSLRRGAAFDLAEIGPDAAAAVPELIDALNDKDCEVRCYAASALGRVVPTDTKVRDILSKLLQDRHPRVRVGAAVGLSHMGAVAAPSVPALLNALNGIPADDPKTRDRVRLAILHALGKIGTPAKAAIPAVVTLLADDKTDASVRRRAAQTLGAMRQAAAPAVFALRRAVTDNDQYVSEAAKQALKDIEGTMKE